MGLGREELGVHRLAIRYVAAKSQSRLKIEIAIGIGIGIERSWERIGPPMAAPVLDPDPDSDFDSDPDLEERKPPTTEGPGVGTRQEDDSRRGAKAQRTTENQIGTIADLPATEKL
jgi:hypothetical protein